MMTFEEYLARKNGDPWEPTHEVRNIKKPLRFVRHRGRVYNVEEVKDGLLHCQTLSRPLKRKALHPIELDREERRSI
jgi:hypothetical protein